MTPRKFTLQKSTWLHGEPEGEVPDHEDTQLHAEDGLECCVGQFFRQNGVPVEELEHHSVCHELTNPIATEYDLVKREGDRTTTTDLFAEAGIYELNDDVGLDDEERIKRLKEQFARLNITMEVQE